MKQLLSALAFALPLLGSPAKTAPAAVEPIPENALRPTVVHASAANLVSWREALPKADLPEGYTLRVVAGFPLVSHPTMGCVDDRGRLFVGDAVGVNWDKAQLEAHPPNRVLLLEDLDGDGHYDKSTVFADRMTFPQGACWLNGSLYVASPPGLWKLTDTDGDGVADQRQQIVGGFDYTGNAADIHGPFAHPNGRLYWCHGRKGHRVTQKDGSLVDESAACGIWSCLPDGSEVQWHSLGCGDNPVEVDFTPEGDIIGVQNLYYSQPRGDALVHWLFGGVYERSDQMQAISHLRRTLDKMPVIHNFGHVAVSGCCFWNRYSGSGATGPGRQFMVTHFNTQRLVRVELTRSGATYKATENEFLKLHHPDIHLTDVMEAQDGSLLLLDGGGWFRIGCPASLMAKPDTLGAVYQVVPISAEKQSPPAVRGPSLAKPPALSDLNALDPHLQRRAMEFFAAHPPLKTSPDYAPLVSSLRELFRQPMDAAREHFLLYLGRLDGLIDLKALPGEKNKLALRRMLSCVAPQEPEDKERLAEICSASLDDVDADLARTCLNRLVVDVDRAVRRMPLFEEWLEAARPSPSQVNALEHFASALASDPNIQELVRRMLTHRSREVQSAALRVLASQSFASCPAAWVSPLKQLLGSNLTPLLLEALKKLNTSAFDPELQAIAADAKTTMPLRLKALHAAKEAQLAGESFEMVKGILLEGAASPAAKIQAAVMLSSAPLKTEQVVSCAPILRSAGPVELKTLLPVVRKAKEPSVGRVLAEALRANPALTSLQESVYRTAFSGYPPEIFERFMHPTLAKASELEAAKMRRLAPLSDKVATAGRAERGKSLFESGKGTCIACHRIGQIGKAIGPDLSTIGSIRTSRDLLESILFPSNTLARDYEAHIIETSDGQQTIGVIRSHTAEGLSVVDLAGQEKNIRHETITGNTTLTTSLMPGGLESTMSESELLDLVAWLVSLH